MAAQLILARSILPSDLEVSLEPLLPLPQDDKLIGMIFVLDKSRTGSCRSLTKEQLTDFITHHGGTVEPKLTSTVTHVFSEAERTHLVKMAADSNIPYLDSRQLAALVDPDYLQREVQRHEAEAREQQAREAAEAAAKKAAAAANQQTQTKKKPRIKRTYSAPVVDDDEEEKERQSSVGVGDGNVLAVKTEPIEDDQDDKTNNGKRKRDEDGGLVATVVKRVARVAKRRRKLEEEKEEATPASANGARDHEENGDSSSGSNSNGECSEMPATPMHERRRRFEGKVFFLLGRFMRKQAEMQAFIEENGGEVAKSISRKVTHLLTATGDDGTLAFKQARQRKLKIITEERLNEYMAEARGARKAMLTVPTTTSTLMANSNGNEQTGLHLLQVPTTPVATAAQRREQAQRVVLTPMPSSSIEPAVLFDASPSWKVIRYKVKKSKKGKKEKTKKKAMKKAKKKSSAHDDDENKENNTSLNCSASP